MASGAGAAPTPVACVGADAIEELGDGRVDRDASGGAATPEVGPEAFVPGVDGLDESGEEIAPVRAVSDDANDEAGAPVWFGGAVEAGEFADGRVWAGEVLGEGAVEGVFADGAGGLGTVRAEASEGADVGALVGAAGAEGRVCDESPSEVVPGICAMDVAPGVPALEALDVRPLALELGEVDPGPGGLGPEGFGAEVLEVGGEVLALVGPESEVSGLGALVDGMGCTSEGTDARGRGSEGGPTDSTVAAAAPGVGGRGADSSTTEPAMTAGAAIAAEGLPVNRDPVPV